MTIDLLPLDAAPRLLFAVPLVPLQGQRFQPTGFPGLGAATFRSPTGDCLLVESAQSMANRLELTVWDEVKQDIKEELTGLSHVRITRPDGSFLTDTVLEAHRLNSPYLMKDSRKQFFNELRAALRGEWETGPIDRNKLTQTLLAYDVSSLLHGVFFANSDLEGGRLRVPRTLSAFIEADGVRIAASGGVKNDHVNPSGDAKSGFGNVPFARDEFTAERITLYANIDLAQIRGYGLGDEVESLLQLLAMYKLRTLLDGNLRLRSACDLGVATSSIVATAPTGFALPEHAAIVTDLKPRIQALASKMTVRTAIYGDKIEPKNAKVKDDGEPGPEDDTDNGTEA